MEEKRDECGERLDEERVERAISEIISSKDSGKPGTICRSDSEILLDKIGEADPQLVARLKNLNAINRFSQTDKGLAEMYVAMFGGVSRYNPTKREYMFYDGIRWKEDEESMKAHNNAKKLADALCVYAASYTDPNDRQEYMKFAAKLMTNRMREIMVKDARDLNCIQSNQLDTNDYLLNCLNGVLDLSGEVSRFIKHDPELLLSKVCNVEYDADAECPLWEKSLAEILEDDVEKIGYIQKVLGMALTGCTKEEQLYFFYGPSSRNGKSTIAETVQDLLGDYCDTLSPESLADKGKDSRQASPDIAKLKGVRLVIVNEPRKKMPFDVALTKNLTGRDAVTARNLYERPFRFVPKFKLLINANHLPLISDDTIFKSERIRVIEFNRYFMGDEQNRDLKDQLKGESAGILNWLLKGWNRYQKEGLEPPVSVQNATDEYRLNSDKIGRFISDCMVKTNVTISAKTVYEHYVEWCNIAGYHVEGRNSFYIELKYRGIFKSSSTIKGKTVRNVVVGYDFSEDDFLEVAADRKVLFE